MAVTNCTQIECPLLPLEMRIVNLVRNEPINPILRYNDNNTNGSVIQLLFSWIGTCVDWIKI